MPVERETVIVAVLISETTNLSRVFKRPLFRHSCSVARVRAVC